MMKGIILAGDSGTRLHPLTLGVPKQLLPIYNKPMVYYALNTLTQSGVKEILVITTKNYLDSFNRALGNGSHLEISIAYACQDKPEGIAQAIMIGQDFIGDDSLCLITGDTVILGDMFKSSLLKAYKAAEKSGNATIFVDKDYDPNQYGVVVFGDKGKTTEIIGVTKKPNYYSITGLYVFPNIVLKHIFNIEKSERNRYEITSVSKVFHECNKLLIQKIPNDCRWLDTSTFDGILESGLLMLKKESTIS